MKLILTGTKKEMSDFFSGFGITEKILEFLEDEGLNYPE